MVELFDSHTHLDSEEFANDQSEVIERAVSTGVTKMLTVGASNGFQSAEQAITLADSYDFIWASAGIHPHDAETEFDTNRLEKLAAHQKVKAIGETGLDFFRDWSPRNLQEKWFRAQISIARNLNKPLIIHSRDAGMKCLEILKQEKAQAVGGVFHCFAENAEFASRLADINFLISFPGTITFKNADNVRDAARQTPLSQIMIETDAPYMAPTPFRGKRCEPAHVLQTAKKLAEVKELPLEQVAKATTDNALNFFRIER